MEHEILFRGKDETDKWLYGCLLNSEMKATICEEILNDFGFVEYRRVSVDKETIGRFTGLTDEAGEDIYEGDIVRYTYHSENGEEKEYLCVVAYEAGAFGIAYGTHHHGNLWLTFDVDFGEKCDNFISFFELMWNSENSDCLTDNYVDSVEVIGNIHDNPELLRGADDPHAERGSADFPKSENCQCGEIAGY